MPEIIAPDEIIALFLAVNKIISHYGQRKLTKRMSSFETYLCVELTAKIFLMDKI